MSFAQAGTYALVASCSGVAGPTPASKAFTISVGPANKIAVNSILPTSVMGGQSFSVSVSVSDSSGNLIPSGSVAVSLSGTGGTLSGATPATLSNGVATFPSLSITVATSSSFSLVFTSGSATGTSAAIAVTAVPTISSFAASTTQSTAGAPITLSWTTTAASSVTISGVSTSFPGGSGSTTVSPTASTSYTLTAANADGQKVSQSTPPIVVSQGQATSIGFSTQPQGGPAGSALPAFAVEGFNANNSLVPLLDGTTCTLVLAENPGDILPAPVTATASGGVATFSGLVLRVAGSYIFAADCSGVVASATNSNSITITAGSLDTLSVLPWPANLSSVASGQPFTVPVSGMDASGNAVGSGNVSVVIASGPAGAVVTGTVTATMTNGSATFSDIILSSPTAGNVTLKFSLGSVFTTSPAIGVLAATTAAGQWIPTALTAASFQTVPSNSITSLAQGGSNLYVSTPYAVGVSADGGKTFSTKTAANGLPNGYLEIAASGNTAYAYDPQGYTTGLYISQNGSNFFASPAFVGSTIVQVAAVSGSTAYVVSSFEGDPMLSVTNDSGSTFQVLPNVTPSDDPNAPLFVDAATGTIYVVVAQNGAYAIESSQDGGVQWSAPSTPPMTGVSQLYEENGTVYVLEYSYGSSSILVSTDGGQSFSGPATPWCSGCVPMAFTVSNGKIYATVEGPASGSVFTTSPTSAGLVVSADGGKTYTTYAQGLYDLQVMGSVAVEQGTIYLEDAYTTYASTNNGASFTQIPGSGFAFLAANSGIYTGYNGLQFIPAGQTTVSSDTVSGLPASGGNLGLAVSGSSVFITSLNGLLKCTSALSCATADGPGSSLGAISAPTLDLANVGSTVYAVWTMAEGSVTTDPYGNTAATYGSDMVIGVSVSQNGGAFTDTGWFTFIPAYSGATIQASPQGTLYVAIDGVGIFSSATGGKSFNKLPAFALPADFDSVYADGNSIYVIASAAGGGDGQFGISLDGGQTITPANPPSYVQAVAELNGTLYIAGGVNGELYASTNNGSSFNLVQVPTNAPISDVSVVGGAIYLNGGNFVSTDGKTFSSYWGLPPYGFSYSGVVVSGGNAYVLMASTYDEMLFQMPAPQ